VNEDSRERSILQSGEILKDELYSNNRSYVQAICSLAKKLLDLPLLGLLLMYRDLLERPKRSSSAVKTQ
jgi:hypothetical protein